MIDRTDTLTGGTFTAINTDLLSGGVSTWLDVALYRSGSFHIIGSAGISAGAIIFEQTNDTTAAAVAWPVEEVSLPTGVHITTAQTIAANASRIFAGAITSRFVRVRISTAFTGGTVRAVASLSDKAYTRAASAVSINGTGAVNVAQLGGTALAAEDAAASATPLIGGGVVRTATTPVTLVAGDAVRDTHAGSGAKVIKPYAVPEAGWNANLALTTATATPIAAAAGASLKRHITALQAINTGTAVDLIILDGATERWRLTLPQNVPVSIGFPTELITTANTALNANLSAVGTVRACFQGYTSS